MLKADSHFYSVVLDLVAQNSSVVSPTQGYHAYALVLGILQRADPELARQLHDTDGPKPLTLSPLQGKFTRSQQGVTLAEGTKYWVRLTILDEVLFASFMDAVAKAYSNSLRLDNAQFTLHRLRVTEQDSPLCRCVTWDELLAGAGSESEISLEFRSPAAFRSAGKRNVIFPEPSLAFGGYLAKLQAACGKDAGGPLGPALFRENVRVKRYRLGTRILHFGSYQEVGFEGRCSFEANALDDEAVRYLNALASFAFFCGTGAKTTMGMGQTALLATPSRRVPEFSPHKASNV